MQNVKITEQNNKLILEVDLTQSFGLTKSGKTTMIGTTNGFTNAYGVLISLNVVRKDK
jgi:hypothetical protein